MRRDDEMVRAPRRRGEVGGNVQPARPVSQSGWFTSNRLSEIPCRVSSDLHEWRNDFPTVSTTDPAKLKYEERCSLAASGRKAPVDFYYSWMLGFGTICLGQVGAFEALALASVESTLKYLPFRAGSRTSVRKPDQEQR